MTRAPEPIEFTIVDPGPAIAAVDRVRNAGSGWVNLSPAVPDEARPAPPSAFGRFFSSRGPMVPMVTISPEGDRRDGTPGPTGLGLAHGHGERLRPWLAEQGLMPPPEWVLKQDHARRGAVWEVGADVASTPVVVLLLDMATRLCPVDTRGHWLAEPH